MPTPISLFVAKETSQQPILFFLDHEIPLLGIVKEFVGINGLRLQSLDSPVSGPFPFKMLTLNCSDSQQLTYAALQNTCKLNSNQTCCPANAQEIVSYLNPSAFGGCQSVQQTTYFLLLGEQLFVRRGNKVSDKVLVFQYNPMSPDQVKLKLIPQDEVQSLGEAVIPLVMKAAPAWLSPSRKISVTGSEPVVATV